MTNANSELSGFNGTVNWYRHSLPGYTYTDGVQHLAATYEAYWLIDLVLSHQCKASVQQQRFQVWELLKARGFTYNVLANDGNGKRVAFQLIPYSSFPFDKATLWLVDGVLMLPSEY